jgi:hypothetical protein
VRDKIFHSAFQRRELKQKEDEKKTRNDLQMSETTSSSSGLRNNSFSSGLSNSIRMPETTSSSSGLNNSIQIPETTSSSSGRDINISNGLHTSISDSNITNLEISPIVSLSNHNKQLDDTLSFPASPQISDPSLSHFLPPVLRTLKNGFFFDRFHYYLYKKRSDINQLFTCTTQLSSKRRDSMSFIYSVVEENLITVKRKKHVRKAFEVIKKLESDSSLNEDIRKELDSVFSLCKILISEQYFKVGISSAESENNIKSRYKTFSKFPNVKCKEVNAKGNPKLLRNIEQNVFKVLKAHTESVVYADSNKFECFKVYDNNGENLINKCRKKIDKVCDSYNNGKQYENEDENEDDSESDENDDENNDDIEILSQSSASQNTRSIVNNVLGEHEQFSKDDENVIRDIAAAITCFICALDIDVTDKNKLIIDILWIGCKNINVLEVVVDILLRQGYNCTILVLDTKIVDVPDKLKNIISFQKTDFLHFFSLNLFDIIYNSVDGGACEVFMLKLLCCGFFYHKQNLLLMSHRKLFKQRRPVENQASSEKGKFLIPACERKNLKTCSGNVEYQYLLIGKAFWSGKEYFFEVNFFISYNIPLFYLHAL